MIGHLRAAAVVAGAPPAFAVSVTDQSVYGVSLFPTAKTVRYTLGTDGVAYRQAVGIPNPIPSQWLNPADATEADLYECRATLLSGSLSIGSTGAWLALTSDRQWARTQSSVGISTCSILVEIRLTGGDGTILSSATITLTAQVESGA